MPSKIKTISYKESRVSYAWERDDSLLDDLKFKIFESDSFVSNPKELPRVEPIDIETKKSYVAFRWDTDIVNIKDIVDLSNNNFKLTLTVRDQVLCSAETVFSKSLMDIDKEVVIDLSVYDYIRLENGPEFIFDITPIKKIEKKDVQVSNPISIVANKVYKTNTIDESDSPFKPTIVVPPFSNGYKDEMGWWIDWKNAQDFTNYEDLVNPREVFEFCVNSLFFDSVKKLEVNRSKEQAVAILKNWVAPAYEEVWYTILTSETISAPEENDEGWIPDKIRLLENHFDKTFKEIKLLFLTNRNELRSYIHSEELNYVTSSIDLV